MGYTGISEGLRVHEGISRRYCARNIVQGLGNESIRVSKMSNKKSLSKNNPSLKYFWSVDQVNDTSQTCKRKTKNHVVCPPISQAHLVTLCPVPLSSINCSRVWRNTRIQTHDPGHKHSTRKRRNHPPITHTQKFSSSGHDDPAHSIITSCNKQ